MPWKQYVNDAERESDMRASLARGDQKQAPATTRSDREDLEVTLATMPGTKQYAAAHERQDTQPFPVEVRREKLRGRLLDFLDNHFAPLLSAERDEAIRVLRVLDLSPLSAFHQHERAILTRWPHLR